MTDPQNPNFSRIKARRESRVFLCAMAGCCTLKARFSRRSAENLQIRPSPHLTRGGPIV